MAAQPPLIEMTGVVKRLAGPVPLRVARLSVAAGDRLALSGLDAGEAELFVNLITGASVADEGAIRIAGADTRSIATDTEWLRSLDRFGIVTDRAVLVGGLTVAANMALPMTLSVDPMSAEVRAQVEALGAEVGLETARLAEAAGALDVYARARVHLARALATGPQILLLEHPTARFTDAVASRDFGKTLARLGDARRLGWLAISDDAAFVRACGGARLTRHPKTGHLRRAGGFWRFWRT
jgi:ABC-type transporter Mla maintaining outer membrane lipid asymmetry ATPase subunit MlaF